MLFAYICIIPGCIRKNSHLNKLIGTSSKNVDGWNTEGIGYLVTKTDDINNYYNFCKKIGGPHDFWASAGGVSTKLYGCGHARLNVGNCFYLFYYYYFFTLFYFFMLVIVGSGEVVKLKSILMEH